MTFKKAAVLGSFDPITIGHETLINKALDLFDELIIGIGYNQQKKYLFDLSFRKLLIEKTFEGKKVKIISYSGLSTDFCEKNNIEIIVRGIRNSLDLELEKSIQRVNEKIGGSQQYLYFLSPPDLEHVSASIFREIYYHDPIKAKSFLPKSIQHLILTT